jgi:protein TonB
MLRPEHVTARQLQNEKAATRRTFTVAFVGALHLLVIYALASGLAANMAAHMIADTQVAVIKEKPPDTAKPPPPPPPDFKIPPPDFVPPPEINIESDAMNNAITQVQNKAPVAPPPSPPVEVTQPRVEGRPHECQSQYPPLSRRLSEQGIVTVKFVIDADGSVSGVTVAKSSGFSRLDEAATECASKWRYFPATSGGKPMAVGYEAYVKYQLTN